ncbi:ABC transporter substrate-binding protein [Microbacterium soli]|uniref:ABC transporter substrate-binding protein n=1 Tax=Microbacterium soli TaxID=446075 RepID=A0ABP7NF47_9MICO
MRASLTLTAFTAIAVTAALTGCGSQGDGGDPASQELVIGSINALTGDLGAYGPPINRGIEVAIQQMNEADAGISARFEDADSESRAEGAVSAARKLVGSGAACLVGPLTTPEALAVLNGVTKARKISIFPEAGSVSLRDEDDDGTIFRVMPPDNLQGRALAQAVSDGIGGAAGKKIAFAYQNSAYGKGLLDSFSSAWEAAGGTIDLTLGYAPTAPTFESEAQKLTAEDYDALVAVDYPETFGKLADALLRTGKYDPSKLYVTASLGLSPIPDAISPEALEGAHGVRPGTITDTDAAKDFDGLASAHGERGAFDAQGFDAAMLCFLAAVAAGSTDPADINSHIADVANAPGTEYTYLELPEAIAALKAGEDIDYTGASGPIELDDNGDSASGLYEEFVYKSGELTVQREINVE